MKTVAVVDGNHMVRRAYHVMEALTDAEGNPTGGIFGFLSSIRTTVGSLRPDRILVVFDGGTDPWRRRIYPEYKDRADKDPRREADRKRHGKAVTWQIEQLTLHLLPYLGIPFVMIPNVEADDLIFVAREKIISRLGIHTIVVSGDKDFLQMVRKDTSVFDPMDRRPTKPMQGPPIIDLDTFKEVSGMKNPQQFLHFRAIIGDKSDRIPGIPGVGEVTAKAVLERFQDLNGVFANKTAVCAMGKRFASIAAGGPIVARNLKLMGLGRRPMSLEEIRLVGRGVMHPVGFIDEDTVRSYCLGKRAMDFVANLRELLGLLQRQRGRAMALSSWVTEQLRELRSSREDANERARTSPSR